MYCKYISENQVLLVFCSRALSNQIQFSRTGYILLEIFNRRVLFSVNLCVCVCVENVNIFSSNYKSQNKLSHKPNCLLVFFIHNQ